MNISKETHLQNLIGSIETMFTNARNKGVIRNKELYLLDLVAMLVNYHNINEISDKQKRQLSVFYFQLLRKYSNLCNNLPKKQFVHISKILETFYVQDGADCDIDDTCYTYPSTDKIFYWQVPDYNDDNDYTEIIAEANYFDGKLFDSKVNFASGTDCTFTQIGRIFIAILDSEAADNYRIFDSLNNDVTHMFVKLYSESIDTILFFSNSVYSHSIMNLKIKLI